MTQSVRWILRILVGLVVVLGLAIAVLYVASSLRLRKHWEVPVEALAIPTDSAAIAYGGHVAAIRGCQGCHRPDLAGGSFIDAPVFGRLWARNLTAGKGGVGSSYADADWVRAIRHGVAPGGRPLLFMPATEFILLDDRDLGSLIAWIKARPPVDSALPASTVGPLGRFLLLSGRLPLLPAEQVDHGAPRPPEVPIGPTVEYGKYLASGCIGCHGETFSGGILPGAPPEMLPARNLTPDKATGIGNWSLEDFRTALRTGMLPGGVQMDSLAMPIAMSRHFTDEESEALFLYFLSLPAKTYGNR